MVGPFRIERLLGRGSIGAVYEAVQVSLRRKVALRLIPATFFETPEQLVRFDHRQHLAASVHHPNLVPIYEVGEWNGGRFIAVRLIHGETLAELRDQRRPPDAESLAPRADAVRNAHTAGVAHGAISARNVLLEPDGTPYLADLGLTARGSLEADVLALARITSASRPTPRSVPMALRLGAGALGLAATTAVVLTLTGGSDAAEVAALGCRDEPSANTPACTIAQTRLDGSAVAVERPGVIRSWTVEGASGDLALQVLRKRDGRAFAVGFSQPQRLDDPAPREFAADIPVRRGDRIGLRLGPGATVGVREASPRSAAARWDGGLTSSPQLVDQATPGVELALRAAIDVGARTTGPRQLLGDRAAVAPAGQALAEVSISLAGGRAARVRAVALPGLIALDLVDGGRVARLEVPDADPGGELLELVQACGPVGVDGFCLRWLNPGDQLPLQHAYRVVGDGRLRLVG